MSDISTLFSQLPIDQIAEQVGASPEETRAAVGAVLPALLGGLQANAQDPAGAASLAQALGQHDPALAEQPSLDQVDTGDGDKIVGHIFGAQQNEVVNRLGGLGSLNQGLVGKLMPILAPIVLAWLAKQLQGQLAGGAASADPAESQPQGAQGGIGDILGQILTGALTQAAGQGGAGQAGAGQAGGGLGGGLGGGVLGSILGGLLGGGRR